MCIAILVYQAWSEGYFRVARFEEIFGFVAVLLLLKMPLKTNQHSYLINIGLVYCICNIVLSVMLSC